MNRGRINRACRAPLVAALGVCLCATLASATGPPAAAVLELVWVDLTDITARGPGPIERASVEVRTLLAPLGVHVTWRVEPAGHDFRPGGVTVVLARSDLDPRHHGRPVGGAVAAHREAGRTLWVFPACVAGGLGLSLGRPDLWSLRQRHAFTRALAVVVAHELAHRLVGADHSPDGLMAEKLCARRLRHHRLEMDARLGPVFRAALAKPPGPEPRPGLVPGGEAGR